MYVNYYEFRLLSIIHLTIVWETDNSNLSCNPNGLTPCLFFNYENNAFSVVLFLI